MLTRSQVVSKYKKLRTSLGETQTATEIEKLPPALCRALILDLVTPSLVRSPYTGVRRESIKWLSAGKDYVGLYLGSETPPIVANLPLAGHKITVGARHFFPYIRKSLDLLASFDPKLVEYIGQWTSLIIWTEREPSYAGTLLTSSTFPMLPHCSFLSSKALQHIPPNNVLGYVSQYALAENLYHEALHQELSAYLLHEDILKSSYNSTDTAKIEVPWRGGSWEPDRVFHAVYVYSRLIPLRELALREYNCSKEEKDWISNSVKEGKIAYQYLWERLQQNKHIFEKGSLEFVDTVIAEVEMF